MISVIFLKEKRREKEGRKKGKTGKRLNALVGTMNNKFSLFILPSSNTRGRGGTWKKQKQKYEETHMHHKQIKRQYTQHTTHTLTSNSIDTYNGWFRITAADEIIFTTIRTDKQSLQPICFVCRIGFGSSDFMQIIDGHFCY